MSKGKTEEFVENRKEVIFLGKKDLRFSKKEMAVVLGYIVKVVPKEEGGYIVARPQKERPGFCSFTCSIENVRIGKKGFIREGWNIKAFNLHKIPQKGWRAARANIL